MRIKRDNGFALIDVLFVCAIIMILSSIALPRLLMAKQAAGAASAIGSMRVINSAQLTFALSCGNGFYAPSLTALGTAPPGSNQSFIAPNLSTSNAVSKSGYLVQMAATPFPTSPATCNGLSAGTTGRGYKAGADAMEPQNFRFFATNATGQIYEDTGSLYGGATEFGPLATGHVLR